MIMYLKVIIIIFLPLFFQAVYLAAKIISMVLAYSLTHTVIIMENIRYMYHITKVCLKDTESG